MNITLLRTLLPVAVALTVSSLGAGAQELIPGTISSISRTGQQSALHSGKSTSVFNAEGTRFQMPVSSGWEKSKAPMRSDEADEYSFTYKIIAPEDQADFKLAAIGMYNPDWQFLMAQYQPEGLYEPVYPEKSIDSPESLSAGTYELLAWGIVKTGEFSYVGYCTHATVDLNSDNQIVTADFSDCVNRLRINCNQGNGEPFPKFDPEVEGEKRSLSFTGRFAYGEAFYDFSIDGSDDFEMLVNDFPEAGTSFYQASFNYLDFGTMSGTSSGSGIRSPFVTDFEGTIQQKYMKHFTNKTSLSPADKAMTVTSMASGSQTLNVYEMGEGFYSVEYAWNAFCSWIDGTPASEMSVYKDMGLNHEPNFNWEDCCFTGFRAFSDEDFVYKYSGPTTYFDNKPVIVGWENYYIDGEHTFLYPKDIFNIDLENQDVVNFLNPLYGVSEPTIYQDWGGEDAISYAYLSQPAFYGMFHEKLYVPEEIVVTNVYFDDEEIEGMDALEGKPFDGHSVKVCMEYPDGWVQDKFAARFRNETVVKLSSERGTDSRAPYINNFQIRDANGKITGKLNLDESGKLYLGLHDYDGTYSTATDTEVVIKVAPYNTVTEGWMELTPDVAEVLPRNNGQFYEYTLHPADFTENVWYDVVIEASDPAGNSMKQTMECCFCFSDLSGVEEIGSDSVSRARYYNLQGIEIPAPEPGLNIVVNGNRISKTIVR